MEHLFLVEMMKTPSFVSAHASAFNYKGVFSQTDFMEPLECSLLECCVGIFLEMSLA